MDYEKKYKEALEKAKESYYRFEGKTVHYDLVKLDLEDMFPELKEREDERIRKALIENFKFFGGDRLETSKWGRDDGLLVTNILAWLEKQGEQKPVSITDEWIEDYWQHKKVNNPYSYDKGEEIQFDHQGFIRFCKKYCKNLAAWSEEDEEISSMLIELVESKEESMEAKVEFVSWLKSLKDRMELKKQKED